MEENKNENQSEKEKRMIENINSTKNSENRINIDIREAEIVKNSWKYSSTKSKVCGIIYLIWLVGWFLAGFIVGFVSKNIIVFCSCIGVFILSIFLPIVFVEIKQHKARNFDENSTNAVRTRAIVTDCMVKSTKYEGYKVRGGRRMKVTSTLYKVRVKYAMYEGEAYSTTCYNKGDEVEIVYNQAKPAICKIIEEISD